MNKSLEKLFENGLIMRTKDVPIPEKIKTTSILLDYILDGGIPTRRITQCYGSFGTGKSSLSACIANEALKQYKDKYVLWLDVENRCSIEWLEQFIDEENRERLLFSQPSVIEECGNLVREIIENVDISLLIVDSIGGAGSARSFDKDLTIAQVGGNAMGVGMFCRAIVPLANKHNFSVIFLNQIRDSIGGFGPSLPGYPGGQALKHALEYNIYMRKTSNRVISKDEFDNDFPIGNEIAFRIVKGNNLGKVIKTNFYTVKTDKNSLGFDRVDEVIRLSMALNLIEKHASSYLYDKFPNGKLVGQNKVVEFLKDKENISILEELESLLYKKLDSKVEINENVEE